MKGNLITAAVILLIGLGLGWIAKPDPPPVFERVEVPVGDLIKLEPQVDLKWLRDPLQKILREELRRSQRAEAQGGGRQEVLEFCRPLVERGAALDTLPALDLTRDEVRALLMSYRVRPPSWNPFASTKIEHFGVTNELDRFRETFRGRGTIEGFVDGDSTRARGSRFGIIPPIVTHGGSFAAGWLLGSSACGS